MTHSVVVTKFASHAREFVIWCQTDHDGKTPKLFKVEALKRLAAIYNAALYLPQLDFRPAPEAPTTTEVQRQVVAQSLLLLPFQYYWGLCEPAVPDADKHPVCGDLFDDFQDIYADLSSGLWLFDGGYVEAAAYSWREMFRLHWGSHVVSALHALHSFEYGE